MTWGEGKARGRGEPTLLILVLANKRIFIYRPASSMQKNILLGSKGFSIGVEIGWEHGVGAY